MSAHLKNSQCNISIANHLIPLALICFCSPFPTFSGYGICFQNCVISNMTKFESHEETPVNLYGVDFKEPFPNNCTILMLYIIPNRKLHTICFQMAYNVVVCTVGKFNLTKIGFGRSTTNRRSGESPVQMDHLA